MSDLYLILTAEAADALRGPTSEGAALEPVALADERIFVLPAAVLEDPAHAVRHAALAILPQRAVAPDEWPAAAPVPDQ